MKSVFLKSQADRRIKLGHLWIYSNEIDTGKSPLKSFETGDLVAIQNYKNEYLGTGYINPNNLLCVRILTRSAAEKIDKGFFKQRISSALQLRQALFPDPYYRLFYGESDFLPGLIIDRYGEYFVIQINTAGMEQFKNIIIEAVEEIFQPKDIILRNDSSARTMEGLDLNISTVSGNKLDVFHVYENSIEFLIPALTGQKTGWFYDHRDNRARLKKYVKEKKVLDLFSYVGGWGVQAACFGASDVTCVDSSAGALEFVQKNAEANKVENKIKTLQADAFDALKQLRQSEHKFDVVILDPPAFIKKRKDLKPGMIAYQRLNEMALQVLNPNGILVSCSCSLHLDRLNLIEILNRSAVKTHHSLQILEEGHQGMDHPIHPAIPETAYLKCFFCRVMPTGKQDEVN